MVRELNFNVGTEHVTCISGVARKFGQGVLIVRAHAPKFLATPAHNFADGQMMCDGQAKLHPLIKAGFTVTGINVTRS